METKYYTPSLEEFYIGFEYEYFYSPLRYKEVAKSNFWEKRIYTGNDFIGCLYPYDEDRREYNAFLRLVPHPGNFLTIEDQVRVKYLDEEDIKSFGFIPGLTWVNQHERYDKGEYCIQLIGDGKITIYEYMGKLLFHGKIKNKSELKKVLQMLDIK